MSVMVKREHTPMSARAGPIAGLRGRRQADDLASVSTTRAALSRHARLRLQTYLAQLAPIYGGAMVVGAWALAFAPGTARMLPGTASVWALAVSILAVASVLAARAAARPKPADRASQGHASSLLLFAGAALFGLGAGLLSARVGALEARLVATVLVSVAAVAMPALLGALRFAGFLALVLGPTVVVHLTGPPGDLRLAAVAAAAATALAGAQLVLSRTLQHAFRNDAEQRSMLRRLEDANESLAADRVALQTESRTDPLTGLANRRYLEEVLQGEWNRCRRSGAPLSCVMLDIDHFKTYNDHYGHDGGDACLRKVAALLADSTRRAGDLVARYGGEEFVVLLPETGTDGASTVAEFLKRAVSDAAIVHAESPLASRLTISAGVATLVPDPARVPGELIKAADLALYEAKRLGRNRVVMADPDTLEAARMAARGLIG